MKKLVLSILIGLAAMPAWAQKKKGRIQPGRIYEPGETLYAPRFGFSAVVPAGWEGLLPRESEVFLLTTTTATYGEIFVFGREQGTLSILHDSWQKGVALSETINLKAVNATIQGDLLTADVVATGEFINKGFQGFAVARCNPAGPCVITLLVAPPQYFQSVKATVTDFMKASSFDSPNSYSPYADFDWTEFLANKVLMSYESVRGGNAENRIHLCQDGTFEATIKKSGMFKSENADYRGNSTGTWLVSGKGEQTMITFSFAKNKHVPLEAPLLIKDEKIYSNNVRYFIGQSDRCK